MNQRRARPPDDGAIIMVTPRPMDDLARYAEGLRERRVSANAVVVESAEGVAVADVADVVAFLASDAGRLISGQNLSLRALCGGGLEAEFARNLPFRVPRARTQLA